MPVSGHAGQDRRDDRAVSGGRGVEIILIKYITQELNNGYDKKIHK